MVKEVSVLEGLSLMKIGTVGVSLEDLQGSQKERAGASTEA